MDITDPGIIFGTPHYMSPEQGHGEPVDERSDLYSLGVILFEMLTGEKPFTDPNPMAIIYKHRHQPVPRLPEASAHWQEYVDALLAKRREDRYAPRLRPRRCCRLRRCGPGQSPPDERRGARSHADAAQRYCKRQRRRPGSMRPCSAGANCWWTMPTARRRPPPLRWR